MDAIGWLRQYRVSGYAVFDFAATFAGILLLSPLLSKGCRKLRVEVPRRNWVYLALPLGITAHLATGRITPMTRDLLDRHSHYFLKAGLLALLLLGLRGIKKA